MNTYEPLVSIVIPVYNGANYMRQAIDSALAQTYGNIEIIVVNDGSTDGGETERIALSYGDQIRYFRKENGGCASALNYGISQMKGEWFSWLSHDDLYLPDKVKSQIDAINENGLDVSRTIICCGTLVIDENGDPVPHVSNGLEGLVSAQGMTRFLLRENSLNGCALLIPKVALDELGPFNTEYVYILDMMYWINLALADYAYFFIPEGLSKNRKHGEQVSVKKRNIRAGELARFAEDVARRVQDDRERAPYAWVYCRIHSCKVGCDLLKAKHKIPMSCRLAVCKALTKRRAKKFVKKILRMR